MTLEQSWQKVNGSAQEAIDWVKDVRTNVKRLDSEADSLITELRRLKNTSSRLGSVANKPIATGFFGLSQAGKSYLISSLAADNEGRLKTKFDDEELDFIKHINPPGGGKEATGLVTRFTRTPQENSVAGYPIELKLFQEIEIAKILLNSYFNDFDSERVTYQLKTETVRQLLAKYTKYSGNKLVKGITADDVVDLQDYAMDCFGKSLQILQGSYWREVVELAPHLSIEQRADLFSILWGEIPELTNTYIQFAKTLSRLSHAKAVCAPLSALVKKIDGSDDWSQKDSIMNVDMLERLNRDTDSNIEVVPRLEDDLGEVVSVSTAELTALTAEMVFPLINKTRVPAVETVDLLDFPGYRGRLNITELSAIEDGDPVSQLILRGKVAYLFERYTDSQEMNVLIVCTPSDKQSEVNSVGPVLERWIHKTQGASTQERALRKPGLLWAITMFDKRIQSDLEKSEAMLKDTWGKGGLLTQTILERFGDFDWFKNWSAEKVPFNNVFLVRKPGFAVPFLEMEAKEEKGIAQDKQSQMNILRQTFIDDEDVKKYIATPEQAWDSMLKLNDGGMQRISDYLSSVALPEVKENRLIEQLNHSIQHVTKTLFADWYEQEGEALIQQKQDIARSVASLMSRKGLLLGELLRSLQLPKQTIRSLYLSDYKAGGIDESDDDGVNKIDDLGFGDVDFDLFSEEPTKSLEPQQNTITESNDARFVQLVFNAWVSHLRDLSSNTRLIQFLDMPSDVIDKLVGELITGANRLKLQDILIETVKHNEQAGQKRDELVERQSFSIYTIISDFIAWLGIVNQDISERPNSKNYPNQFVFEYIPTKEVNGLPQLQSTPKPYTKDYVLDWLVAFGNLAVNNAGHSAGREITPTQNLQLGTILSAFEQSSIG